ncbi:MAG: carboxypeptidase regulatory-like domain-containing protein [Planctomycetes bacterium]|nr:carboxypeptidase regulatory-like domain-containing protein [Planctomycetota bacterium]
MNRPSHWILAVLGVTAIALVATGRVQEYLQGAPAGPRTAVAPQPQPARVVPRRDVQAPGVAVHVLKGLVVDRLGWPVESARVSVDARHVDPRQVESRQVESAQARRRADDVSDTDAATRTDAQGRFEVRWAGALQGSLLIEAPGRHAPVRVPPSLDEIQVVLQDALPWPQLGPEPQPASAAPLLVGEGFLKAPQGTDLSGGRVRVPENGALAVPDATGRFVVPLRPGPISLVAWNDGGLVATSEARSTRQQGKVPLPDLVLQPGLCLRGRLVDRSGEPIPDVRVLIENAGSERVVRSDVGGQFCCEGLVPTETAVTVIPHRGSLGLRRIVALNSDVDLLDLVLERPRQEPLRLRVVDQERVPQPWVHVVADQGDGLCRAYGQADAGGEVLLGGLGNGPVAFEVRGTDFDPLSVADFDAPSRTLVVRR